MSSPALLETQICVKKTCSIIDKKSKPQFAKCSGTWSLPCVIIPGRYFLTSIWYWYWYINIDIFAVYRVQDLQPLRHQWEWRPGAAYAKMMIIDHPLKMLWWNWRSDDNTIITWEHHFLKEEFRQCPDLDCFDFGCCPYGGGAKSWQPSLSSFSCCSAMIVIVAITCKKSHFNS